MGLRNIFDKANRSITIRDYENSARSYGDDHRLFDLLFASPRTDLALASSHCRGDCVFNQYSGACYHKTGL